ncbi:hypothetical protein NEMIN01_2097 [Nematocida minor]|uniref:uncharacterized protein n=1 Tax=Nematocida minor TaxID=1912983 RepID=UPI00221E83B5|nr:uncharacterized protein NEMIN01_2097 [Nematocida minor]KAI5192584.1 hypothetical protein NEMIN01_2097 [Nematocida minor]
MAAYTALYSHRNALIDESESEGINRIIVYSAAEILDHVLRERKTDLFLRIVEYNGKKVSACVLENGYKVFAVFHSTEDEREEMKRLREIFREKVVRGEFNAFEF